MNADLLSTAAGGKSARRANRAERNKLFKAISNGNSDDVEFDYDLDEAEAIERIIADEEDEMMYGTRELSLLPTPSLFDADGQTLISWSSRLEAQEQEQEGSQLRRCFLRIARFAMGHRSTEEGRQEARTCCRSSCCTRSRQTRRSEIRQEVERKDGEQVLDDSRFEERRLDYELDHSRVHRLRPTGQTLDLPPMSKKSRIAVHLLAEVYGLKSRSMGSGKHRFPVLERTRKTTIAGVSERRIRAIVGTADGEYELDDGYAYGGGRGGKSKTGKVGGLWKALEGASGRKPGRSGGGGGMRKNNEGAVVGQGVRHPLSILVCCSDLDTHLTYLATTQADKLGSDNIGFALLKKMGSV
jgi:hypothetical protein